MLSSSPQPATQAKHTMGKPSTTNPSHHAFNPLWIAILIVLHPVLHPYILLAQATVSAATASLLLPSAIVYDPQGNLYIAETGNHVIRKIDLQGQITTIAGTGTQGFSGDNGPATAAQLDSPQGLALDTANNLYIADTHNHRIRKLTASTQTITTIAGTGSQGFSGDSGIATAAQLYLPTVLAIDANGNLYLADSANHRIRRINVATQIITTIAGTGIQGFTGDNSLATAANIDSPTGLALDTANNLYLADTHNHRIRRIDAATSQITTIAGDGSLSSLALPKGLSTDANGNLYLADSANHRIRRIDAVTGQITTIAGNGTQTFSGDGDPAIAASLDSPRATTLSPSSLVTIADTGNQRIRQIDTQSNLNLIAGLGLTTPNALSLTAASIITYGTGTITANLTSGTPATGTVTFLDITPNSTTTLATIPLTTNTATLSTATLPAGQHHISATYTGDPTHLASQSTTFALTINPQPVQVMLSPVNILYGQPIPTLTGSLTGLLPQDLATVTVIFTTYAINLSSTGTYPIAASLTGASAGNYTLTANPATVIISPATTLTTLVASTTATPPATPITFNAHVATTHHWFAHRLSHHPRWHNPTHQPLPSMLQAIYPSPPALSLSAPMLSPPSTPETPTLPPAPLRPHYSTSPQPPPSRTSPSLSPAPPLKTPSPEHLSPFPSPPKPRESWIAPSPSPPQACPLEPQPPSTPLIFPPAHPQATSLSLSSHQSLNLRVGNHQ